MSDRKPLLRGPLSLMLLLAGCTQAQVVPAPGGAPVTTPTVSPTTSPMNSETTNPVTAPATNPVTSQVTGTATYRERIALPPTAVVIVRLVDVSLADAPSVLLTEQAIRTEGRQVPFEFALGYDPARILPSHTYAVQVRIEDRGKLLFISDTMNPVITRDAPTRVDIVLRRI